MARILMMAALCFSIPAWAAAAEEGTWEPIGTFKGVKTWRKKVPGTKVLAFRGELVAKIHMAKLMKTFLDRSQRKYWVDRYAEHKTIDSPDLLRELYWIHFDLPFPISDRDYLLRADGANDEANGVFTYSIKSDTDERVPPNKCCVRAEARGTYYKFQAVKGQEEVKLEVEVHTDPKGSIPDWLINAIQKKWPGKTLSALVARAQQLNEMSADYSNWHQGAPQPESATKKPEEPAKAEETTAKP